jgi:hypothetical protein
MSNPAGRKVRELGVIPAAPGFYFVSFWSFDPTGDIDTDIYKKPVIGWRIYSVEYPDNTSFRHVEPLGPTGEQIGTYWILDPTGLVTEHSEEGAFFDSLEDFHAAKVKEEHAARCERPA